MNRPPIEEIRERVGRATAGPWRFGNMPEGELMILDARSDGKYVATVRIHQTPRQYGLSEEPNRQANAQFIAHARQDVPALLDYIAFLEKGFEELASDCKEYDAPDGLEHEEGQRYFSLGIMRICKPRDPNLHAAVSQAKERI